MTEPELAKRFYVTEPSRGVFIVNFQLDGEIQRFRISQDQIGLFLVDGAGMAHRACGLFSRLGPEAFEPAKLYAEPA